MQSFKYALLLGADLATRERAIICTARALQCPVVLMSFPGGGPVSQKRRIANGIADDVIVCEDSFLPEAAVLAARAYEKQTGGVPLAVIPVNDFAMKSAAAIAASYQLPHLPEQTIERCRDKLAMKQALQAAGLRVAKLLATNRDALSYQFEDGQPAVLKPSEFAGSGGVKLVRNPAQVQQAWDEASALLGSFGKELNIDTSRIHLEEYLASEREVSVEVYCTPEGHRTAAVTQKYLSPPPHFAEVGHSVPYKGADEEQIRITGERACRALGIDRGVAHVEIKILPDALAVVEVAARPAGGKILDLVYRALQIDLYALHATGYVGQWDTGFVAQNRGTSAISFLKAPAGMIRSITVSDLPAGIHELALYKGVGDRSRPLSDFTTRDGHVEWFWPTNGGATPDFQMFAQRLSHAIFQVSEE